jgi:hypothetical protein
MYRAALESREWRVDELGSERSHYAPPHHGPLPRPHW